MGFGSFSSRYEWLKMIRSQAQLGVDEARRKHQLLQPPPPGPSPGPGAMVTNLNCARVHFIYL